jgi:hypothetical protein
MPAPQELLEMSNKPANAENVPATTRGFTI